MRSCGSSLGFLVVAFLLSQQTAVGLPRTASPVRPIVERMAAYVARWETQGAVLAGEERTLQRMESDRVAYTSRLSQQLTAKVVFVAGGDPSAWVTYRDVIVLDGEPRSDKPERLWESFEEGKGDALAKQLSAESALLAARPIKVFGDPMVLLGLLHPDSVGRFDFTSKAAKGMGGRRVALLRFRETRHPTLFRTRRGREVPCSGEVWVDEATGAILKLIVELKDWSDEKLTRDSASPDSGATGGARVVLASTTPGVPSSQSSQAPQTPPRVTPIPEPAAPVYGTQSPKPFYQRSDSRLQIEITFRHDPTLGLWVPLRMSEQYEGPMAGLRHQLMVGRSTSVSDFTGFHRLGQK